MTSFIDPPGSEAAARPRRLQLARDWAAVVSTTSYVPMSPAEIEEFLLGLVDVIADALQDEPFDAAPVAAVGSRLVAAHFTGPETLRHTVEVLGHALLFTPELRDVPRLPEKVVSLLGELSTSFATAMRLDALDQQEEIKWALLWAKQRVERALKVTEQRFREVFTSSPLGIAITNLDGTCVEVNAALSEMLEVEENSLVGTRLSALFHPEDAPLLATLYSDVADGAAQPFREQRRLVRADGEPMWAHLAVSLLRDADGEPAFHVTIVEDVSELHLLQKNLDFQLLHDSLTGLSNRQHFVTQLEAMHSRSAITLYHLALDAFSVVNNGIGHEAGDQLLKVVARRLENLVEGQRAVVARTSGDEFAIVVEHTPASRPVHEMIERINEELGEPTWIGDHGLALSATTGVVDRPSQGTDVPELLRAANATLHRAKARGKRQWLSYDQRLDARDRERFQRAAALPGAVESGELEVVYQPLVDLRTRRVAGVEARLGWGDVGHEECLALAEQTGMSLPIGRWALREACERAVLWPDVPLHVALTPTQSLDEDLVASVKSALDETGLPPHRLHVAFNTGALLSAVDEDDNAQVLTDSGVSTGLDGFLGGYDELVLLTQLPLRSLTTCRTPRDPLLRAAVREMVSVVHRADVTVLAADVATAEDAAWWESIGVEAARGDFFSPPVPADEVAALLGTTDA
ncbi:putative bifunctional diguanylate cyclase/phosphodiesterase [Umezawaea beigongshangensis]|uniref:putative bifunctional diguanylate cyclase/phosphodiesterase n=1 Tax=Umezawaea beigongshangensis TaxID=2780383 RepID=UPI0018F1D7CD|nr:EAL domain-containing protein [Umezawaea beigongshangensis]